MTNLRAELKKAIPRRVLWRFRPVRMSWAGAGDRNANFGDQIAPHIIERLYGVRTKHVGMAQADLISTGSLLDWAERDVRDRAPAVWGSGFLADGGEWRGRTLRPVAVRGRLSAKRISPANPQRLALGDPGILMARAFPELAAVQTSTISVVPHFTDYQRLSEESAGLHEDLGIIDVLAPFESVVQAIAGSRAVLSSSLHGLVIAESYGVPNFWIHPGAGVEGGRYKFDDYYSAFDVAREPSTVQEITENLPRLLEQWRPLPGLQRLQDDLIASFTLPVRTRR